jgi:hypothetical protein
MGRAAFLMACIFVSGCNNNSMNDRAYVITQSQFEEAEPVSSTDE